MVNEYNDPGYRPMTTINLAGFLPRSAVNGPGIRAVVWVQGCPFRCEGCFNPHFQPFVSADLTDAGALAARITALPALDGVTFSGGEPFAQARPLAHLGKLLKRSGLDIVTYTGYPVDDLLETRDPAWQDLILVSDILVAGPFKKELACSGSMAGSSNQRIVPLTARGRTALAVEGSAGASMEFTIDQAGTVTTTGFPKAGFLQQLAQRTGDA